MALPDLFRAEYIERVAGRQTGKGEMERENEKGKMAQ